MYKQVVMIFHIMEEVDIHKVIVLTEQATADIFSLL